MCPLYADNQSFYPFIHLFSIYSPYTDLYTCVQCGVTHKGIINTCMGYHSNDILSFYGYLLQLTDKNMSPC